LGVREERALRQRMDALQKLPPGLAGETVLAMTDTDLDLLAAAAAGPEAHYEWVLGNIVRRLEKPLQAAPMRQVFLCKVSEVQRPTYIRNR
jgi:hypothetical protein